MRILVQRVGKAAVRVNDQLISEIGRGYLLLVGFCEEDNEEVLKKMAGKIVNLRIFEDENNKMNRSILDVGGEVLSVSQFTLYGDCRKGNRPSFIEAAKSEKARELYEHFNEILGEMVEVKTGIFQADMQVELVNDGPVTLMLDSRG